MNWKEKVYFPSENSKYVLSDGSLSPYWKEIRDQVLKSDNYTCQRCGSKRNLSIHHIIPRIDKGSDEIENLITLCYHCHNEIELSGLKTRNLIINSLEEELSEIREISETWQSWVYGGCKRSK